MSAVPILSAASARIAADLALPKPLTPPDCNLQDFAFMPLDVQRLRDSDLASDETPEACWAAVLLWCASWHQVPAASIPDNDQWMAKQAGYLSRGRIDPNWAKVRDGALRGFVMCSDGRYYHPVVADKAIDAWRSKLEQRWKTECARIKKHNQRHNLSLPLPEFEAWLSLNCPQGQPLHVPGDNGELSPRTPPPCPPNVPRETPSKGQGEGQGQGQGEALIPAPTGARPLDPDPGAEVNPKKPADDEPPEPQKPGFPDCPYAALRKLWAKHMPGLRQPRVWEGQRKVTMRNRWQQAATPSEFSPEGYTTEAGGIAWWDGFFAYIATETKLPHGFGSDRAWRPTLEWVCNAANFQKIIDGNYAL